MLLVPGSLEGASPSPLRPEAGERLCPVKAVVWVFVAALRDLREVIEDWGEKGNQFRGVQKTPPQLPPPFLTVHNPLPRNLLSLRFKSLTEVQVQFILVGPSLPNTIPKNVLPLPLCSPPTNLPNPPPSHSLPTSFTTHL